MRFALLAPLLLVLGCATYREDLNRGQRLYEENQYERALAIWRVLEADMDSLSLTDQARYAYLRGMTDFRLGFRPYARHWLGVARAIGRNELETAVIQWNMADYGWIDREALEGTLRAYYRQQGYLQAEVSVDAPVEEAGRAILPVQIQEGPRATIRLNRPEVLNAFDFRMLREIARAAEDASWDDEVRAVVVTGTGRAFCVGADLRSWDEDYLGRPSDYWKWFGAFKDAHDRLREIGKPTIARVNGIAVGGGNELQMACDLAVIVDTAFIRHVGLQHGSVPAGGATQWLQLMVGDRRAREIVFLCDEIPAVQAAEWGLVNGHRETWSFGKGWSLVRFSAHMIEPQVQPLIGVPGSWTAGTRGTVTAEVVRAQIASEADFDRYRAALREITRESNDLLLRVVEDVSYAYSDGHAHGWTAEGLAPECERFLDQLVNTRNAFIGRHQRVLLDALQRPVAYAG